MRAPWRNSTPTNALSVRRLRDEGSVKIVKFDDFVLKALLTISRDVVAEIGSGDDLSRKIYASYEQFRASITDWSDIAERAFLNGRGLVVTKAWRLRMTLACKGVSSMARNVPGINLPGFYWSYLLRAIMDIAATEERHNPRFWRRRY